MTLAAASPLSRPPLEDRKRTYDVLVVGGGINGVCIARDLAGRGLSVLLVERDDLASHTSSSSTKLIHGGLRYLEYYEFNLVRKSLIEREVLLASAPHIMWPLRFVMPHDPSMRPAWMIRAGLFLYDHLASRKVLAGSRAVDLHRHPAGAPLKQGFGRGFIYSDGWVDDARLVVLNAQDAQRRGAVVLTRTECVSAQRGATHWQATLREAAQGEFQVSARCLVNAAGPWAERFLRTQAQQHDTKSLRLVKGSHIVVRQRFEHDHAYIFQNPDKRIIFAIPYEGRFTLIGTTDVEISGDPGSATIDAQEIAYLCEQASRYFSQPIEPSDVVWSYCGVRPLLDDTAGDPAAVTRDYLLELDTQGAPVLSVWGGKLTTSRKLGEEAADRIAPLLGCTQPAWTHSAHLPGGDFAPLIGSRGRPDEDFDKLVAHWRARFAWLSPALVLRLSRAYGSAVAQVLRNAHTPEELGPEIAPGVYEAELEYLAEHEWAHTADDMLWRRSKLGLHLNAHEQRRIGAWFHLRAGLLQPEGAPA